MLALVAGLLGLAAALAEALRARVAGRTIRWWVAVPLSVIGVALLWLWWTHLRFPLVQPIAQPTV